jgi:hypothetical protein
MRHGYLYLRLLISIGLLAGLLLIASSVVFNLHAKFETLHARYQLTADMRAVFQLLQRELKSSAGLLDNSSYPTDSQQLSFLDAAHTPRTLTCKNQRLALIGEGTTYLSAKEYLITQFIVLSPEPSVVRINFTVPFQGQNYSFQRSFRLLNVKD